MAAPPREHCLDVDVRSKSVEQAVKQAEIRFRLLEQRPLAHRQGRRCHPMDSQGHMCVLRPSGAEPDAVDQSRLLAVMPTELKEWLSGKEAELPNIVFKDLDLWRINAALRVVEFAGLHLTHTEARELGVVVTCLDQQLARDILGRLTQPQAVGAAILVLQADGSMD